MSKLLHSRQRGLLGWTLLLLATLLLSSNLVRAQVDLYTFAPSTGTYTSIANATGATNVTSVQVDTGLSAALPIGFSFVFDGVTYTQVKASSNGFLSFNTTGTSGQGTNNLNTVAATSRPLVAPLWDDLDGRATVGGVTNSSRANYLTTGTAGSRVFTFEWQNWEWNWSATTPVVSFQVKLYEGTNVVQFIYQPESGAISNGSASVGLAGAASGEFLSLSSLGTTPTTSSTAETVNIATQPAAGQIYTFTPPVPAPCPQPRTLSASALTSTGATVSYTVSNATPGPFTIFYGPTGFNPAQPSSATNVYQTTTATGTTATLTGLTPQTGYQFYVRQDCGGSNGNSILSNVGAFTTNPNPAINNDCAQAIGISVAASCTTPVVGTVFGATQSLAPSTGCGGTVATDVWYSFVATASALQLTTGAQFTGFYDVRSGTCATSTSVTCGSLGTTSSPAQVVLSGLTVSQTYFLRIYATSTTPPTNTTSGFTLCLTPVINYCNTGLGGSCGGNGITDVSITGTTFNATGLTCTSAGSQSYTAYPATGANTATLQSGVPYQVSVTLATGTIAALWIDYNQNLVFEASEFTQIATNSTGTATVVSIVIPTNAVQGPTGLRIRTRSSGSANGPTDACTQFFTGETKDFTITIGTPVACPTPTNLTASNITGTGATIGFTPVPGTASYTVTYTPAGGTATTVTPAPTNSPVVLTGLTPSTTYTVRIAGNCGGGTSSVANTITFTTGCVTAAYATVNNTTPYTQDFEATWLSLCGVNEAPSVNWRNTPVTGNNSWRRDDDGTSGGWASPTLGSYTPAGSPIGGATSAHSARFHSYNILGRSTGSLDLYLNMSGTSGTPSLSFDYINTSGTDSLMVFVSTNGGSSFSTSPLAGFGIAGTWTQQTVNLPTTGLSATTIIRLRAVGDFGATDIGLDNVRIAYVACPTVTGLTATGLTSTAATINFTTSAASTTYNLTITPAGGTATTQTATTSPVNLTGLTPQTSYTVSIVSNCGGGTTSQPSVFTFSTLAVPPTNDDCAGAINVPIQFGTTCVGQTSANNTGATASTGVPAPGCGSYVGRDLWFKVTVPVGGTLTVQTLPVTGGSPIVDTGIAIYSGACGSLTLVECDDDDSPTGNYSLVELTGRTPGEVLYVRAWAFNNNNAGLIAVCATSPSNCAPPTAPTSSNVTNTTANLSWAATPAAGNTFEIEYGLQGFTPGTGTTVVGVTGISTTLTGLTPNTNYCFYVRQNCGTTNGSSAYVGPTCFTTLLTVPSNDEPCGALAL
ncbi:fibronectin type III domain-containing protein, partial [Hymenobacter terrenus]|uniref:fibronectin type III domain-containing protein n=1 Tax=Hymenobacter terrenus TaxID=1629124 RepID=UPI0012E0230A